MQDTLHYMTKHSLVVLLYLLLFFALVQDHLEHHAPELCHATQQL